MQKDQVLKAIAETPKGANIILAWERDAHVKKGVLSLIRKATVAVGRIGVEYDHLKAVIGKRESGELPKVNAGLNGMEWVDYPFILRSLKTGKLLLRLAKGTSKTTTPSVQWTKDGITVEKEQVMDALLANEKTPIAGDCLTVCLDDLIRIHAEMDMAQTILNVEPSETAPAPEQTDELRVDEPAPHAEATGLLTD